MTTLSTVNVKITGDTGQLVSSLTVAEKRVTAFSSKISTIGTAEARGLSNLGRGFLNAAGQSGVLNSEISILASSVGNIGLATAGAGIGFGLLAGGIGASIKSSIDFESAITKVAKTANFSAKETQQFGDAILDMSRRLPIATADLTNIAVVAGQLGIQGTSNIASFVEEVAKLSSTTGVASETLATSLGTLTQVSNLPITAVKNISAAITQLGNTSNSTEQQILDFATRLVGVTSALGVPVADLLGISSSFAAAGVDAERGATAIQRVFIAIDTAASEGGDKLQTFADVAGQTTEEFKNLVATDPGLAFARFVEGLKNVDNVIPVLDSLGIADSRLIAATLSVANSNASVTKSIQDSRQAAIEATATNTEFARTAETTAAKFQILKNNIHASAVEIGDVFNPAVAAGLDALNDLVSADIPDSINQIKKNFNDLAGALQKVGENADTAFGILASVPQVGPVLALASAYETLASRIADAGFRASDLLNLIPGPIGNIIQLASHDFVGGGSNLPPLHGVGGGSAPGVSGFINDNPALTLGGPDLLGFNKATSADVAKRTIPIPAGGGSGGGPNAADLAAKSLAELNAAFEEFHKATGGAIDDFLALIRVQQDKESLGQRQLSASVGLKAAQLEAIDGNFQLKKGLVEIAEAAVSAGITLPAQIAKVFAGIADGLKSAASGLFSRPTRESAQLQLRIDQLQLRADQAAAKGKEDKAAKAAIDALEKQKKLLDDKAAIQQDELTLADQTLQTEKERNFSVQLYKIAIENSTRAQDEATATASLQAIAQQHLIDSMLTAADANNATAGISSQASNLAFFNALPSDKRTDLARLLESLAGQAPSFAVGTSFVPHDTLAMVHRGEQIIPAGESGVRGGNIAYVTLNIAGDVPEAQARRHYGELVHQLREELGMEAISGQRLPLGIYTSR